MKTIDLDFDVYEKLKIAQEAIQKESDITLSNQTTIEYLIDYYLDYDNKQAE